MLRCAAQRVWTRDNRVSYIVMDLYDPQHGITAGSEHLNVTPSQFVELADAMRTHGIEVEYCWYDNQF